MHPHLTLLRDELELGLAGLSTPQTQLRPRQQPVKWSTQQNVRHLLMTYTLTEKAFDSKIAQGRPTNAKVTLPQRAAQFVVLRGGYIPYGRMAPERVCPPSDEPPESAEMLVSQVSSALSALNLKLATMEALFGPDTRSVTHMVLGPLSVDQWAKFHLIHGRHHLKQIAAIRKQYGI